MLKNINDNEEVLSILFNELLKCKVRPYYLFQCDREIGCEDFVVDLDKGIELINNIQERVSGLGVPKYVVDSPQKKKVLGPFCKG